MGQGIVVVEFRGWSFPDLDRRNHSQGEYDVKF